MPGVHLTDNMVSPAKNKVGAGAITAKVMEYTISVSVVELEEASWAWKPKWQGSGTLVEIGGRHFIATCRHLFVPENGERLGFVVHPREFQIESHYVNPSENAVICPATAPLRSDNREPSDLAFIELSRPDLIVEAGYKFYALKRLVFPLEFVSGLAAGLLGTTLTYTRSKAGKYHADAELVGIWGRLCTDIRWNSDGTQNRDLIECIAEAGYGPPLPESYEGMSGGGLWVVDEDDNPCLTGIVIAHDSTRLVATNIDLWVRFTLAKAFNARLREFNEVDCERPDGVVT